MPRHFSHVHFTPKKELIDLHSVTPEISEVKSGNSVPSNIP